MSVNFYKNRDELVAAYQECLDPKCNTNWAMFGYEKQTNDLMLLDKGEGGLSELAGEFNPAKIQYAFCVAKDEQTGVSRFLLINWQGESAPMQRKGLCLNHFRDVQQFFKGANVVLQAQNEDEVEPEVLMSHVMKMSNRIKIDKTPQSNNNSSNDERPKPVGTNYQRINAQNEISQIDRETFWEKQKKEDEAQRKIDRQKEAETRATRTGVDSQSTEKGNDKPSIPNKSVELRQARMDEAKQLIGKRSISSAKAFFENANSAPQTNQIRKAPIKIDREPVSKDVSNGNVSKTVLETVSANSEYDKKYDKIDSVNPVVETPVNGNGHLNNIQNGLTKVPEEEEDEVDDVAERDYEDSEIVINNDDGSSSEEMCVPTIELSDFATRNSYYDAYRPLENIQEENEEDNEDYGIRARALYDYQAAEEGEITFDPDDIITHIEQIDAGWWQGLSPKGVYGLFPANYVELLPN